MRSRRPEQQHGLSGNFRFAIIELRSADFPQIMSHTRVLFRGWSIISARKFPGPAATIMLNPPNSDDALRLRDYFRAVGYTHEGLHDVLGIRFPLPSYSPQMPMLLARTARKSPFDILARCFFLARPISASDADIIPQEVLIILQTCGLLVSDRPGWRASALLSPCRGLWLASDTYEQRESAGGREHVTAISQPALALLDFAIAEPTGELLDLCSGTLVHGLAAGGSCRRVVGSDLNPRARMFGAFNAALNGRTNVDCVTGDRFSALGGQLFDLVLSNPPFVLSPGDEFLFRDNPLELDGFCRRLIGEVPGHLKDGGFCQLICEWVEIAGQSWEERLAEWFVGSGCDVWVLAANRQLPTTYARDWVYESGMYGAGDLDARYDEWLEHLSRRNVKAIHGGLIFMRRRAADNWVSFGRIEDSSGGESVGAAVRQGFAARDFLQAYREDKDLLGARLRIAPGACLEYQAHWRSGAWEPERMVLRVEGGIPVRVGLDANVRSLIERLERFATLREVIEDLSVDVGLPAQAIETDCLQMLRRLVDQGCLVPWHSEAQSQ